MTIRKLPGSQIESNTITITQIQTTAVTNIVTQAGPRVSSLIYPGNDTAGNTVGGQTVYINGSGFETNNAIYINGNAVPSKSFISASNLSFTTPALAAGIYPVYIINTDSGATAIFIPGYISSAEPAWVTSAGSLTESQDELTAWSYSLSATGDAPITYALAAGSSLPTGVSLAANGLISGTITSPSGNATTYTFSVVATDAQNQDSTRQFTVTTTTGEGVLFANNVLLIHADGTNNQNNHHFLDSSNNNFTITRNGNATQGSFSPFSQTGWSAYFDGTGDYLSLGTTSSFNFLHNSTALFTIEGSIYSPSFSAERVIFDTTAGSSTGIGVSFWVSTSGNLRLLIGKGIGGSAVIDATSTGTVPTNSWVHLAVVYDQSLGSNNCIFYINGVASGTANKTVNAPSSSNSTNSGRINSYGNTAGGACHLSNIRVNNSLVYNSNFTPPTAPLTNIANTSLLTLQSNRFIDNSNNNFTITPNGDVSIQAFSPFAPTVAYSTANVGGSAYFDGTGDYLTLPSSSNLALGAGDFSVEMWVYFTGSPASDQLLTNISSSETEFSFRIDASNYPKVQSWFTNYAISNTAVTSDQWYHLVACRASNTLSIFVNGKRTANATVTNNFSSTNAMTIGGTSGTEFCGYISSMRITKGSSPYDPTLTTLTVPTAPLTNIANTSLLCNFTNAGIFDQTAKNVLETVGDAKVSTAQYKYGTGSMVFDGTGDYLSVPDNPLLELESGDFTIEAWIYVVSYVPNSAIVSKAANGPFLIFIGGSSEISFYASTTGSGWSINDLRFATNPATSTWHHIAVTRSGSNVRTFFNGTLANSTTLSGSLINNSSPLLVGYYSASFNGYIDDLRITKGYARYTSNFTAPTAALQDK